MLRNPYAWQNIAVLIPTHDIKLTKCDLSTVSTSYSKACTFALTESITMMLEFSIFQQNKIKYGTILRNIFPNSSIILRTINA